MFYANSLTYVYQASPFLALDMICVYVYMYVCCVCVCVCVIIIHLVFQQLQVREYFMRIIPTRAFTCKVCPATRVSVNCRW